MNDSNEAPVRYWPLGQLVLARLREFYREPEALFWVYGFPILISVALGFAFRNKPVERITVAVQQESGGEEGVAFVDGALKSDARYVVRREDPATCHSLLRTGKTDLVVIPAPDGESCKYLYDPTRPEGVLARSKVDDTLQRSAGRKDVVHATDEEVTEPGGRYIDFLIPGLLGMSLMGSTSNLLMLFMSVELASLPSYVMAGFRKNNRIGAEASLKYVLFGAVTSSVMVYGL